MTLATSDAKGRPSARIVLLKGVDPRGFVFFTNYQSRKGRDIAANPQVALTFLWKELERQVRIEGRAEKVTADESSASGSMCMPTPGRQMLTTTRASASAIVVITSK